MNVCLLKSGSLKFLVCVCVCLYIQIHIFTETQALADLAAQKVVVKYTDVEQPILSIQQGIATNSFNPVDIKPTVIGDPDGESAVVHMSTIVGDPDGESAVACMPTIFGDPDGESAVVHMSSIIGDPDGESAVGHMSTINHVNHLWWPR